MENLDAAASAAAEPATTVVIEELPPRASPSQAVSLLVNAAVGAGVLSLPFAFRCAGYIGGPLILASVAIIESFTLYVLSKWAEKTNAASYGEVVLRSAGPAAATALCVTIFFYLFGSGVAYLVILGDCFHPLISRVLGATWYTTRKAAIISIGTAVVLPMCFAESLSAAASISGVNFVAFLLVVVAIIGRSAETLAAADERRFVGVKAFAPTWVAAVPIAVFGLQCHAQVVAVFNELREYSTVTGTNDNGEVIGEEGGEDEHEKQIESRSSLLARIRIEDSLLIWRSPSRKKRKSFKLVAMTKIIITAITITAAGYALVGLPAYLAYPTSVESNIFNTFPHDDPLIQIVRAIVGVIEIASFPVNHLPARQAVKDAFFTATGIQLGGKSFIITETLVFYIGTLILALVVNDLGRVFSLTGGVCGSAIILGMPGLLLVQYAWKKQDESTDSRQLTSFPILSPLLEEGGEEEQEGRQDAPRNGNAKYNVWTSKFFWSGVVLIVACATLIGYTIAATVFF